MSEACTDKTACIMRRKFTLIPVAIKAEVCGVPDQFPELLDYLDEECLP